MRKRRHLGWERDGLVRGGLRGGFVPRFTPAQLAPYAWYDAHLGGSVAGINDLSGNALPPMTAAAGSNAPLFLPYTAPSIYLPDISQTLTTTVTPSSTPTFTYQATLDVPWRAAGYNPLTLVTDGTGRTFLFYLQDGTFNTRHWNGASDTFTFIADINADSRFVNGTKREIRCTWVNATKTVTVEERLPGATAWTGVGSPVVSATTWTGPLGGSANVTAYASSGRIFDAALSIGDKTLAVLPFACTRTGYTDAYGNVWSITRATTGRKPVVQSPADGSAESLFLLGVDDKLDGPLAAVPPCGNAASASMLAVVRPWATQASPKVIFTTRSGSGAGVTLRMASATTIVADVSDGTTTNTTSAVTFTPGLRAVVGVHLSSGGTAYCTVDNTAGGTVARPSGTQAGGVLVAGADSTPANFLDAECRVPWYALDHLASAGEIANLVSFFGGGL